MLTEDQRRDLRRSAKSDPVSVRQARRAKMILLGDEGWTTPRLHSGLGVDRIQVGRWRNRFLARGLAAIAAPFHNVSGDSMVPIEHHVQQARIERDAADTGLASGIESTGD